MSASQPGSHEANLESPSSPEPHTPVQKPQSWHLHILQWLSPPSGLQNASHLGSVASPMMPDVQEGGGGAAAIATMAPRLLLLPCWPVHLTAVEAAAGAGVGCAVAGNAAAGVLLASAASASQKLQLLHLHISQWESAKYGSQNASHVSYRASSGRYESHGTPSRQKPQP